MAKVMVRAMSTSMKMRQRIWKMKLFLAKKIKSQERSLAKEIYEELLKNDWPGLSVEVKEICQEIGVHNLWRLMRPQRFMLPYF